MIQHGGNINAATVKYGISKENWLDLSTGLNPNAWKTDKTIPQHYYQTLPYPDASFYSVASRYYKTSEILAVPGSQAAIQAIPRLLVNKKVALPVPGYEEHFYHWQQNGHQCLTYNPNTTSLVELVAEQKTDVVVVINPNNPSCKLYSKDELLSVIKLIETQNGLLIIDEAFLDTRAIESLMDIESEHLIILRSLGKFFGLPGIRIGFVKASQYWRDLLKEYLGAWPLNGPSLWIATLCLADTHWQEQSHTRLKLTSEQQKKFLQATLGVNLASTDFFMSMFTSLELATYIQDFYANQGILIRLVDLTKANTPYESIIRFGLCPDEAKKRFETATRALSECLIVKRHVKS